VLRPFLAGEISGGKEKYMVAQVIKTERGDEAETANGCKLKLVVGCRAKDD
jgi:hypothetical protein